MMNGLSGIQREGAMPFESVRAVISQRNEA
jgi:hypothetical protein